MTISPLDNSILCHKTMNMSITLKDKNKNKKLVKGKTNLFEKYFKNLKNLFSYARSKESTKEYVSRHSEEARPAEGTCL